MSNEKYLTTKEIAEMFQVSVQTVNKWQREGRIKPKKMGYHIYRYPVSEIKNFLKEK